MASNVKGSNIRREKLADDFAALEKLPKLLQDYIKFEAPAPISCSSIYDLLWGDCFDPMWDNPKKVLEFMRKCDREDHRQLHGGVHPSIDPPRRVW